MSPVSRTTWRALWLLQIPVVPLNAFTLTRQASWPLTIFLGLALINLVWLWDSAWGKPVEEAQ